MATRDSFVDVNDGDQLNDGYFNGISDTFNPGKNKITYTESGTADNNTGTTSATYQDIATLNTPTSLQDSQKILIEATVVSANVTDTSASGKIRIYDNTDAAVIDEITGITDLRFSRFLAGTVTIASASGNKEIKLQYASDGSDTHRYNQFKIRCAYYED
jgi:hypothetical protein